jgi:hypothetical protein
MMLLDVKFNIYKCPIHTIELKFTFLFKFAIWSMYNVPLKLLLSRILQKKIYKTTQLETMWLDHYTNHPFSGGTTIVGT